jgi:large subunit ribosomal protein L15
VKILGRGELTAKVNITAHKFSGSAKAMIEGQGGNCSEI